jgi:hypothetical protein
MKKLFPLTSPTHKPDRQVEFVKKDVNKYVSRERRKPFPKGVDYWDFDCKCGVTEESAVVIRVGEFSQEIDKAVAAKAANVYIEILAKPGIRKKKTPPAPRTHASDESEESEDF